MRPRSCAGKQEHRLHYCGACKTLGSRYGQSSRMLLNHDTVFMAELLSELSAAPAEWPTQYRSFNCMAMPKEFPVTLDYAAAATVLLTHWKIADHCEDTVSRAWQLARRLFDSTSRKAEAHLRRWNFPLQELDATLGAQQQLESRATALEQVAEPTAHATGLFFQHGAIIIDRMDLATPLYQLGLAFGELVYLIDAFEDFDKDQATGAFNALRRFGLDRTWARGQLRQLAATIQARLAGLPLQENFRGMVTARLNANIAAKLGESLPVLTCATHRLTWRERWRNATAYARQLRDKENPGWMKGMAVVAGVTFIAFAVPQWAKAAHNSKECLSLGFNLMALGSVMATVAEAATGQKESKFKSCCGSCVPNDCDCSCCDCCCECGACGDCCGSCDCGGCDC